MMDKKAMSALFKLVVVLAVVLILILSLVVLIVKLGKSSVDVISEEQFTLAFVLSQSLLRKYLKL
jgi:hypothetical protein